MVSEEDLDNVFILGQGVNGHFMVLLSRTFPFLNSKALRKFAQRDSPNMPQALAWKRLENGSHTSEDITWLKHEFAERHHETKFDSGYSEAHKRAQKRFDGDPWPSIEFDHDY